MPINPQVAAAGISAIGSLFSSGMSLGAASASSHKQYKYAKRLMDRQAKLNYQYGIKGLKESPTAEREGLETAGYNPMLAVQNATSGANSGWTGSQSVQAPDYGSAVSNALDFKRLENESKATDSTVKLQNEQSQTEESKRKNLEFQNSMLDVEKHLKQKDLDTYDKRFYTEMYKMMQESEKLRQEASVVGYNAESQRIIANADKTNAETNKQWTPAKIGSGLITGIGLGALTALGPGKFAKGAKAVAKGAKAVKSAKRSKQVSSVIPNLHTFGKTRTHR